MDIGQRILNGFPTLATGNVADAGRGQIKLMDSGIKPLHYSMRLAGPAYTVDTPATSNFPIQEAIIAAPVGSIIVVNASGCMESGHIGDLMALGCQVRGIGGLVIDGAVRDVADIIAMKFPVFARGTFPHGNTAQEGICNKPIQCGGITINPGDIIFGDATGVVVIPADKAEEIYQRAVAIANSELGFVQQLNEGKDLLAMPEFLALHHIDLATLKKK